MSYRHIENLYKNKEILMFKQCIASEKVHGCLHKDTLVATVGGYKCIKDIQSNEKVFCFNEYSKEFELKNVKQKIIQSANGKWLSITLDNGKKITVTEGHLFLTKQGCWIAAKDLDPYLDELVDLE